MPGFPVASVDVRAVVSLGTKQQCLTFHHFAHRQNVPGVLRDNVDCYKINFGLAVTYRPSTCVPLDAQGIQTFPHVGDAFYLYAPQLLPALHDEVKGVDGAIRLGHHEAELGRLVQKGHFTKVAVLANYEPAFPCSPSGTALLGRWNASA